MKICIMIFSLAGGGAERFATILANGLSEKNDVEIVYFKECKNEYYLNPRINKSLVDFSFSLKGIHKVYKYLNRTNYDAYIAIDIIPNLLICLYKLLNPSKKVIISERNAPKETSLNPILKITRNILYSLANKIVFQTEGAKNSYRNKISSKGVVIFNPVRSDLPEKCKNENKEFVSIGRLADQKNYPLLFHAFALVSKKFPEYKLRIFGDGEKKEELMNLCKKLNLEKKVIFEGYIKNVNEKMKYSQIYVMTSLYEGMPNALIEAMGMGFPVICSDCPSGGPRELIVNEVNGLLFKNNNVNELIKCMELLIMDENLRKDIGKKATEIKKDLSINKIIDQWEFLISLVVQEK